MFLLYLPYIEKLPSETTYKLSFIESKLCEEQFWVLHDFEFCFVNLFSHIGDATYLK